MEIVKKEILKNVQEYKYYGFLCYLFKNSEEIRNMILSRLLSFHDLDKIELSNETCYDHSRVVDYDLKVIEKNGSCEEFYLSIFPDSDDLVIFFQLRSKEEKRMDDIDLAVHYNFYILCDCKELIFDKFLIKDTDIKKIVGINKTNLKISEQNILEFHCTVSLDCLEEIMINNDFTHFMYLLKYNKPYDENHSIYKEIDSYHNDYLNSDQYALDLEYELNQAKERALNRN